MVTHNDNEEPQELDLSQLIADEKADKARESAQLSTSKKRAARPKKVGIIAASTVGVLLLGTIAIYDPFTQSLRWSDDASQVQTGYTGEGTKGGSGGTKPNQVDPYAWAKEPGAVFPTKTSPWEETSYLDSIQDGMNDSKGVKFRETALGSSSQVLPSEAGGFTSDDSKAMNEDGTLNPLYSYWTQEVFYSESSDILERILNPVYGNWSLMQFSESVNPDLAKSYFSDVMTPKALEAGVPLMADWNKDDFGLGDQLLSASQGNRWIGTVNSMTTDFVFNDEAQQYDVILVAKVTYSAWTQDRETLTKDATLTLNLGANVEKTIASEKKVIINSSTLEF